MVLVASLYELSRPSSPSGLLHGLAYTDLRAAVRAYAARFFSERATLMLISPIDVRHLCHLVFYVYERRLATSRLFGENCTYDDGERMMKNVFKEKKSSLTCEWTSLLCDSYGTARMRHHWDERRRWSHEYDFLTILQVLLAASWRNPPSLNQNHLTRVNTRVIIKPLCARMVSSERRGFTSSIDR